MKKIVRSLIAGLVLLVIVMDAYAQKNTNRDTVYYLVDTTAVPVKDRMFDIGVEGYFHYYRLMCQCYPWQLNPTFTYVVKRKGVSMSKQEVEKTQFITLQKLIDIAVQYGISKVEKTVFYFIEPSDNAFIKHEVYLMPPRKPEILYDIQSVGKKNSP